MKKAIIILALILNAKLNYSQIAIKQYKAAKKGKLEFVDAAAAFAELDNIRASK